MPCPKGKRINVLGILSASEAKLEAHIPDGRMTSEFVLKVLDGMSEKTKGDDIPSVLALDNASIHTAHIIQDKRAEWEEKNLFLYFLPAYSPELNLIEIPLQRSVANPKLYAVVYRDVRQAIVRRFPYVVLYREAPGEILVISIFHTAQDPSRWQARAK